MSDEATSKLHTDAADVANILHPTDFKEEHSYWLINWLINWTLSSPKKLREAEKRLLSHLRTSYRGFYVDIGSVVSNADAVWTICLNTESREVPLVVVHGLASGLALWILNLDALAKDRPVYAIDLLGFGRSSRPQFSSEPEVCEQQIVESIEEWRRELKIKHMVLLGHSMGAFVVGSYALSYPQHIKHLILAEPWGYNEQLLPVSRPLPLWMRIVEHVSPWLNPYWVLRAAGPFGMPLLCATTEEIFHAFGPLLGNNIAVLTQYMHQCNAAAPSGEAAFHTLSKNFTYAKNPLLHRIKNLSASIGITFIYAENSWTDIQTGLIIKSMRKNSFVEVYILKNCGHHVQIEMADEFNDIVADVCKRHARGAKGNLVFGQYSKLFQQQKAWLDMQERNMFLK